MVADDKIINFREFRVSDFDTLVEHDQQMSQQFSSPRTSLQHETLETYDEQWLWKITDPTRNVYKNWHTIVATTRKSESGDGIDDDSKKPIAFLIWKHMKNGCFKPPTDGGSAVQKRRKTNNKRRRRKRRRADYIEIFFLSVSKSYQRQGIGTSFIKEQAMSFCRERKTIEEMRLHVLERNTNAIQCYEKMGFEKQRLILNYPQKGYNSWRMICDLNGDTNS